MTPDRRASLRLALCRLADAHAATIDLMEQAYALLADELALDPLDYFARRGGRPAAEPVTSERPVVDRSRMAVVYRGRECFLGNSLGLRLLDRLADRPDRYVSYDDLLADVWDGGHRSDAAVRSVVRDLRRRLRAAGLGDLAAAIDGSVSGHYALRLPR